MKKQQGFVLVFTVVLLLVAAILGLYAMRSTIMQDKMTANIYNKTITTNTVEQGATVFLSWFENHLKVHGWPTDESVQSAWKNAIPYINTGKLEANFGDNGYYWIDPDYENPCDANPCWDNINKTVTVFITGNLVKDKGDSSAILGESIYKIELATLEGGKPFSLPELPAALTYAGTLNGFKAPSSGASINGGDKIAVATGNYDAQDKITTNIKEQNEDNYSGKDCSTPCVSVADLKDWGNAEKVKNLADQLASLKEATVYREDYAGKLPCSGIIIAYKNLTISGNAFNKCNKKFQGIILALGEKFDVNGSGGMNIDGAIFAGNIQNVGNTETPKFQFGTQSSIINGGGNFIIQYNSKYFGNNSNTEFTDTEPTSAKILSWKDVI
ncbi:hypothetical protein [Acinetobacter sp. AND/436]|uniref:hypothetical protein n=1 Tax=Acinetobacter sp. AND/436 TaxID=3414736 RepID=UPI003C2C2D52